MFRVALRFELKKPEAIFRCKALRMLLSKGKITEEMDRLLRGVRFLVAVTPRDGYKGCREQRRCVVYWATILYFHSKCFGMIPCPQRCRRVD